MIFVLVCCRIPFANLKIPMSEVIVRFPPSPTGLLHIGTVRTCLFNYLFAKKNHGKIIMRLEDTDTERSTQEYAENIMSGLQKLGITWDEGPFYQSERGAIYREHLEQLLQSGKAYYCFCTADELEAERMQQEANKQPPRYSGKCRHVSLAEAEMRLANGEKAVIRFRVPDDRAAIEFADIVRGKVSIHVQEIADFVIAKNLDTALYNFVVVVDDHLMQVSHVIRGEDHISNTPKQILISEAFGWQSPRFAHLPLILNPDKSKLSKRKNQVSVDDYLADGILPEALINFLALLGWNTADENEFFTLEELVDHFSLERVQKAGAVFDIERLLWLNGVWIRKKSLSEIKELVWKYLEGDPIFVEGRSQYGEDFYESAIGLVHERLKKLSEAPDFLRFFFVPEDDFSLSAEMFPHDKMKVDGAMAKAALIEAETVLAAVAEDDWTEAHLEAVLLKSVEKLGVKNGQLLWPIRVALSGEKFSPGVFELLGVFGKERSLARIKKGIGFL